MSAFDTRVEGNSSLSSRETEVVACVETALDFLAKHERDANFCLGAAWATFNIILEELGRTPREPPWNMSDEQQKVSK